MGRPSPSVRARAEAWRPDLYILTGDEIEFTKDGWRDGEAIRHDMQQSFRETLAEFGVPWLEVRGTPEERLAAACARIDELLAGGWQLAEPL